jgi:hypothetical protein
MIGKTIKIWKERLDLSTENKNEWSCTSTPLYGLWSPRTGIALFLGALHEVSNTANGVPGNVAQLLDQGVLCFEIVRF